MLNALTPVAPAAIAQVYRTPSYFDEVLLLLLVAGALGWLLAALLGFSRARAYGPAVRWFALSAVCLVLYHLHFLVIGYALARQSTDLVLTVGAFFNFFVLAGAVCAVIGFWQLNKPRPADVESDEEEELLGEEPRT